MKVLFSLAVIALFFLPSSVHTASALTISPVRIEVQGDPGQTLRGELEILNEQAEVKQFYSSFENFEPSGETGSPHFVGAQDGLATWMQTEQFIEIQPNEKKIVPYTITIPQNAEPGGYFSAIFWGGQDPSTLEAGEVSIGGKLGVLILLRVNGDIEEGAGISEFTTDVKARLFSSLPIGFSYRFTNTGGDRVVPLGDIVITNTFGKTSATISANEKEGNVLPGSARRFSAVWETDATHSTSTTFFVTAGQQLQDFHFGLYTAKLSVVYGATNQMATDSITFVIIPWQLLLIVAVVLALLTVALKKYNAWIIAKSRT
jgi:hypothetical protein